MKKITIPKIAVDSYNADELEKLFATLEPNSIANCNWPEEYPYTPTATFKAFHNGKKLFVQFNVTENDIHSVITEDFGEVWTDPCVEMFIAPDEQTYYNFECTCIGRLLVACHAQGKETVRMPKNLLDGVERYPSLGTENFPLRKGENSWSLIEVIPVESLFNHNIESWDGKTMRANFYKCGDNLPTPHFISWNRIDFPKPNFHLPEFFGEVIFE